MTNESLIAEETESFISGRPPYWLVLSLIGVSVAGVLALVLGLLTGNSTRTWTAYLVNFLFWSSIAHFGVLFSAILTLTRAQWGWVYVRLAQSLSAFLPVSFVLFLIFIIGGSHLFPWVEEPIPEKALWLNYPFMAVRDGFGLFLLLGLALTTLFYSLRPEAWRLQGHGGAWARRSYRMLIRDFKDLETERELCRKALMRVSLGMTVVYCFVFSLIAGDLIMSLSPHWYSTLFGAYYFVGSIYLGLAALAVLAGLLRKPLRLDAFITNDHRHDLGKLLFAFCLISVDMFWSQFLVIWFANIPEEASFIALRVQHQPWRTMSWTVLLACFAIPFLILLGRAAKRNSKSLFLVSSLIIIGYWVERVLLVVPSVSSTFSLGWIEIGLAAWFLALFALSVVAFLRAFPPLPVSNEPLYEHQ
ncbi:MAG: hypothetical protein HY645_12390 [Acidobacteria bacterium]|nr:hypothetical protein [Acidobacteriota bacterium]